MSVKVPYFKIETFGAVDGPGVRLVLFTQGCPLRCVYCHNPESWKTNIKAKTITASEVLALYRKNKSFYRNGGITISGGEPLIHQDFCLGIAKLCSEENISLAFDTSGATFDKKSLPFYKKLIKYKPLWIVDIKHIDRVKHFQITGSRLQTELHLIKFLEDHKQLYWIRQVLVPHLTDKPKDLMAIGKFIHKLKYMGNFELLPYHRLALDKYKNLNIKYKLVNTLEPTREQIAVAKQYIQLGK